MLQCHGKFLVTLLLSMLYYTILTYVYVVCVIINEAIISTNTFIIHDTLCIFMDTM